MPEDAEQIELSQLQSVAVVGEVGMEGGVGHTR